MTSDKPTPLLLRQKALGLIRLLRTLRQAQQPSNPATQDIDVDLNAIGAEPTTATLSVVIDDEDVIIAQFNEELYLYDHPIYLDPDNGIPTVGNPGYFVLNGSYPDDGQLRYRLANDVAYKPYYTGVVTNSEIDRMANGELVYFAYAVDQRWDGVSYNSNGSPAYTNGTPNQIYIYKPKTYAGVDNGSTTTPDVVNPIVRKVDLQAAQGANLTFRKDGNTTTGGYTVNETFQFSVIPDELITNAKLNFQFLKDGFPVAVTDEPNVTGGDAPIDGQFNVTVSRIKVSGLLIIVDYQVVTSNASIQTAKAWTNDDKLFISSTVNGIAKVYSVNGTLVKTVKLEAGQTTITDLPKGNYVIALPTGSTEKVNAR
jgi:hypothetical protein